MEELVGVMNSRLDLPEEGSVNRNRGPHGQGGVRYVGGLVVPSLQSLIFLAMMAWKIQLYGFFAQNNSLNFKEHHWKNQVKLPAYLLEAGEVNTPSNREQRYAATDLIFLFDHKAEFIQIV